MCKEGWKFYHYIILRNFCDIQNIANWKEKKIEFKTKLKMK